MVGSTPTRFRQFDRGPHPAGRFFRQTPVWFDPPPFDFAQGKRRVEGDPGTAVSKSKSRKKYSAGKEARRRARELAGPPPPERIIPDKRRKPPKHKKKLLEEELP